MAIDRNPVTSANKSKHRDPRTGLSSRRPFRLDHEHTRLSDNHVIRVAARRELDVVHDDCPARKTRQLASSVQFGLGPCHRRSGSDRRHQRRDSKYSNMCSELHP